MLRRVHRAAPRKKRTKAQVLKAIRNWKSVPKHSVGRAAEDHAGTLILLDTNVIIDAHYGVGDHRVRAMNLISSAVIDNGAAINCDYAG